MAKKTKEWQLAYDALERLTVGREAAPSMVDKADYDFDLLLAGKLEKEKIKYWAEYQREWIMLNAK